MRVFGPGFGQGFLHDGAARAASIAVRVRKVSASQYCRSFGDGK
jgi:hypothetical protein